ncbi:alanine/glycine:cation symporter family protein [Streptomyces sp. TRM 70361]|uniref:alanine/glycine:cation symporter family protein n=1 Tax=Streptomyces sp. TRM 70361 TaxID=3116553 RepID=UPI002E7C5520|nr:alanine/glycine:cation symporter family protein [Streptomyces sp. TRM 70361]MEE1937889.1 alanine/glycine:cation symporter family protein [Streptomyces sp. TRM 70361]
MAENESWTTRVDEAISDFVDPVAREIGEIVFYTIPLGDTEFPWIVGWLVVAGLVFTGYFGFAQVRHIGTAFKLVRGRYDQKNAPGEVTHFQALTSAVSGTVGLGNIAGVAIAVTIGGPGATFWMIICGLLGMATKFVECTLGVKYREVHEDGTVSGGPMHYLRRGMTERGLGGVGKVLAAGSAVAILFFTFFGGNLFQVNQSLEQLQSVTGKDDSIFSTSGGALFFGIFLAALVALVLLGGMRSIGAVTSRLVPAMAIIYVTACLFVILGNISQVPAAIGDIVGEAFAPEGVAGGLIGALIVGFQRAAFSNEAGIGSAPIAHSAVKTKRPATEGLVAMIEPFIDTVVICTMTALTIVIARTPSWEAAREASADGEPIASGVSLTSDAFESVISWFPYVLAVAVILFAFSTVITWSYYGLKAWAYIFGRSKASENTYKVLFSLIVITGALMSLSSLVSLADSFLFIAAVFNIIGLYFLAPVVKKELDRVLDYVRRREAGETEEQIEAGEAGGTEETTSLAK